jgi:hypothetical protein
MFFAALISVAMRIIALCRVKSSTIYSREGLHAEEKKSFV